MSKQEPKYKISPSGYLSNITAEEKNELIASLFPDYAFRVFDNATESAEDCLKTLRYIQQWNIDNMVTLSKLPESYEHASLFENFWPEPRENKLFNVTKEDNAFDIRGHTLNNKTYVDAEYDYIVIGTGAAGFATSVLLQKAGKKVLALELHEIPGGQMGSFTLKNQYEYEVGLHSLDDQIVRNPIFVRMLKGSGMTFVGLDEPYEEVLIKDMHFGVSNEFKNQIKNIIKKYPHEARGFEEMEKFYNQGLKELSFFISHGYHNIDKILDGTYEGPWKEMEEKGYLLFKTSANEMLHKWFTDPELIYCLSYRRAYMGNKPKDDIPFLLVAAFWAANAPVYPVGGYMALVNAFTRCFENWGGKLYTNATVTGMDIDENGICRGVTTKNGFRFRAKEGVISSAGLSATYRDMLSPEQRERFELNAVLESSLCQPSNSNFHVFLGLDVDPLQYDVPRRHFFMAEEARVKENDPLAQCVYFLSVDPSYQVRHPNSGTVTLTISSEYDEWKPWEHLPVRRRGKEYMEKKKLIGDKMVELFLKHFPQFKDHLVFREDASPLSCKDFTGKPFGANFGLYHNSSRWVNKENSKWIKFSTPIKNLWLNGQDMLTSSAAMALHSAYILSSSLLKKSFLPIKLSRPDPEFMMKVRALRLIARNARSILKEKYNIEFNEPWIIHPF